MLIHNCQYTDREYPHHLGWGHSPMSDALEFGHRVGAERLLMFHHDPLHTDADLDAIASEVSARWSDFGHAPAQVEVAGRAPRARDRAGAGASPLTIEHQRRILYRPLRYRCASLGCWPPR